MDHILKDLSLTFLRHFGHLYVKFMDFLKSSSHPSLDARTIIRLLIFSHKLIINYGELITQLNGKLNIIRVLVHPHMQKQKSTFLTCKNIKFILSTQTKKISKRLIWPLTKNTLMREKNG